MWLLIDDKRDLNTEVIARTYDTGMKLLALGGWECVCFDHDLGENEDEKNGYTLLTWALENGFMSPMVQIVTDNPVGRNKMISALYDAGYVLHRDKVTYVKHGLEKS